MPLLQGLYCNHMQMVDGCCRKSHQEIAVDMMNVVQHCRPVVSFAEPTRLHCWNGSIKTASTWPGMKQ